MIKETLEEASEKILANNIDGLKDALKDDDLFFFYKGVIKCYGEAMAKWQQERSYSEEEAEMCEKIADEFAIGFAEWKDKLRPSQMVSFWSKNGEFKGTFDMDNEQLLEIYKKEKELLNQNL